MGRVIFAILMCCEGVIWDWGKTLRERRRICGSHHVYSFTCPYDDNHKDGSVYSIILYKTIRRQFDSTLSFGKTTTGTVVMVFASLSYSCSQDSLPLTITTCPKNLFCILFEKRRKFSSFWVRSNLALFFAARNSSESTQRTANGTSTVFRVSTEVVAPSISSVTDSHICKTHIPTCSPTVTHGDCFEWCFMYPHSTFLTTPPM
ncbi:hypothetical protein AGDE_16028 [Angomonas deanei]|nr:hypothetical protein AGDE_16028 [Angomonas deanei]|eukprot:EPY17865.1 hypothetical protein AGDE_16028 [Angomonas deanei]